MKVMILNTACCWKPHSYPFLHLAKKLQDRGFDTFQVFEKELQCSYKDKNWEHLCSINKEKIEKCAVENGLTYNFLSDYLSEDSKAKVNKALEGLDINNWKEQNYDDLNLFTITKGSIFRILRKVIKEPSLDEFEVIKSYYIAAALSIEAFKDLYRNTKPDVVVFLNGLWYLERLAFEIARRFGIRTFAHENSSFNDRKFFDPNGVVANRHTFAVNSAHYLEARILKDSESLILKDYFQDIYKGVKNTIAQASPEDSAKIRKKLSIPNQRKIALLISQVPYDTVMVYDSPIYDHLIDFIEDTIEIFRQSRDYHLIVRLHPYEEIGNNNETLRALIKKEIPKNVSIVHSKQINTYSLMDICDFGITVTSQAGLEMLSKHKPVVVLGNSFYANKGFTYDVKDRDSYPIILKNLMKNPSCSKNDVENINKFLYVMIFEYLIPFDLKTNKFTNDGIEKIVGLLTAGGTIYPVNSYVKGALNNCKGRSDRDGFVDTWKNYKKKKLWLNLRKNKLHFIRKGIMELIYSFKSLIKVFF